MGSFPDKARRAAMSAGRHLLSFRQTSAGGQRANLSPLIEPRASIWSSRRRRRIAVGSHHVLTTVRGWLYLAVVREHVASDGRGRRRPRYAKAPAPLRPTR